MADRDTDQLVIRPATNADFEAIWRIFQAIVATGDTYVFAADTPRREAFDYFLGPGITTYVAEDNGRVVGFYKLIPNGRDRGSHVANASYMVDPAARGRGIGRQLGLHSLREARRQRYRAMQFNFVVSTNTPAVSLWQDLGFTIVGTLPNAFNHATRGYVDAYVMYRTLNDSDLSL